MDLNFIDGVKSKLSGRPFNLEFAVTRNCNSKCRMCNQHKQLWENELSLEEISRIFSSYRDFTMVGLTGGEPTLRKDLAEIMKIIVKSQPGLKRLFLTSNGFLPDQLKKTLVDFCSWLGNPGNLKTTVLISLDGPEKIHNRIRGRSYAHSRAVKSISELADLRKLYDFNLGTVSTYGPWNYRDYDQVLAEIRRIRDLYDTEPAFCFIWFGELYRNMLPEDGLEYWETIREDRFKIMELLNESGSLLMNARSLFWLFADRFQEAPGYQVIPCSGAQVRYFLDSYGQIHPCIVWPEVLADLRKENYDLNTVFTGPVRLRARKLIQARKCPGCYVTCEFIPTMMSHPAQLAKLVLKEAYNGSI